MKIQIRQYADEISRPKDDTDESQLWLIAGLDNALETVMIYNKVSGSILAANKRSSLTNVGIPGVLDLSGTKQAPGTPILVYPKHNPVAKNQGWYLQYME
ncbi:MAG: hypothetical protein Q9197_002752 [Variospora fuerteventurae]